MSLTISDADFHRLAKFIKSGYGIDLTRKRQLITSRLSAPVQAKGFRDFTSFIDSLLAGRDPEDVAMLLNRITTNYTFFMREKEHFEFFSQSILPDLVRRHAQDRVLSIWSAGCSTGEEPYNISMYIMDYLGRAACQWDTRVLATDISQRVLDVAEKGVYALPDSIPADWKQNYFVPEKDGEQYRVAPKIRDNVIFQPFNLMDPIRFRLKFDVIFCRNVMIYFDQPTKDALVQRFHGATVPNGYLLIGYAENLSSGTPYRRLAPATFQRR